MIRLCVLTPNGIVLDEDVTSFSVPSKKGALVIEGKYTPIYEILENAGVLKVVSTKGTSYYAIFNSSIRVTPMKALLCCTLCERGYDINAARANASADRARKRLEEKSDGIDLVRAKASLNRALVRLSVKSLSEGS